MARRHGWQLPADSFQVLATTVFFLLSIAFYAFFAPFLGKKLYEFVTVAVYSIFAFSVIILYIRCASIDPADSGILIVGNGTSTCKSQIGSCPGNPNPVDLSPELKTRKKKAITCTGIAWCFCKEGCQNNLDNTQRQPNHVEGLFCTLCNAEVGKLSKHCRSCDKCVDGFDHHCRWLNNCIGRKNYVTFLLLMTTSLAWGTVQSGVGITVLVRCFVHKLAIQNEVMGRLGDVFSRVSFTIIVAICTTLTLIAMAPLGELFFFHMILIRKGITTYDYVVAVRTQSEPAVNERQYLPSSPFSSAPTAISGSSLGLQYKGAWCTPPRISANDPDEIMPHLEPHSIPSNVDADVLEPSESAKRALKPPVRLSAWKLAKLDPNEAMRAAAKARASSSVLRPINSRMEHDADRHSSKNMSSINSLAGTPISLHFKGSCPPSRASMGKQEMRRLNAPITLNSPNAPVKDAQKHSTTKHFNPIFQSSMNRSQWSTMTSEGENEMLSSGGLSPAAVIVSSSVHWDQEAGRFVSSQNIAGSSSTTGNHNGFVYNGRSIFNGDPLSNDEGFKTCN